MFRARHHLPNRCHLERSEGSAVLFAFPSIAYPVLSFPGALVVPASSFSCFRPSNFRLSTLNCRPSTSPLSQRLRINIIPFHLTILCFHTLTHSFVLRKLLTLVLSVASALSALNTEGWGIPSRLSALDAYDQSLLPCYLLLTTHHSPPAVHCTPPPPSNLFGAKPHA
jgi:hypothetical protein